MSNNQIIAAVLFAFFFGILFGALIVSNSRK